jgi:hypothetical protein
VSRRAEDFCTLQEDTMQTPDLFGDVGGGARPSPTTKDDFDAFWTDYPRKRAKLDARRAWKGLTRSERAAATQALPKHRASWAAHRTALIHIPYPATWLRGHQWEDELDPVPQRPAPAPAAAVDRWWISHVAMERKGHAVGAGSARAGESTEQYRARIQQAIDDQARYGDAPS